MKLKNNQFSYGIVACALHWVAVPLVIGLFFLGDWMVGLDYYSQWYQEAPVYHKSLGVLLAILTLLRVLWRFYSPPPPAPESHARREVGLSHITHWLTYGLLFGLFVSGYLISTADGRALEVFNWFAVPSAGEWINNQEDVAGNIHHWIAHALLVLFVLHVLAVLKHSFADKGATLKRMLSGRNQENPQ